MPGERLFQSLQGKGAPPGQVSWHAFSQMVGQVGWPQNVAQQMWSNTDRDNSGLLNQPEFMGFCNDHTVTPYIQQLEAQLPQNGGYPAPGGGGGGYGGGGISPENVNLIPGGPGKQQMGDMSHCNGVVLKQKVELMEAVTNGCCEGANTYAIYDRDTARPMYVITEKSQCFERCCCKPSHAADMEVHETPDGKSKGRKIYTFEKPRKLTCCLCCPALCECCRDEIKVYQGDKENGKLLGSAMAPIGGGCCKPTLDMMDAQQQPFGQLVGPCCCIGSWCDTSFMFTKQGGSGTTGFIKKEGVDGASSAAKELFTDADNFTSSFDPALNGEQKATFLASMILLDYMFFEDDGNFKCEGCQKFSIKCCDCYFIGCKIPCKCTCDFGGDDNQEGM